MINHGMIRQAAIAVVSGLLSVEGGGEYVDGAGAYTIEWQVRKLFLGEALLVDLVRGVWMETCCIEMSVVVCCLGGVLRFRRLRLD